MKIYLVGRVGLVHLLIEKMKRGNQYFQRAQMLTPQGPPTQYPKAILLTCQLKHLWIIVENLVDLPDSSVSSDAGHRDNKGKS